MGTPIERVGLPNNLESERLGDDPVESSPKGNSKGFTRGLLARAGGRGNHGRWIGERFVAADEIVESIRMLLADSWTVGDLKREMAKKFGGTGRSFERYLRVARARNIQQAGKTASESKADAMHQWHRLLVEAKSEQRRTYANLLAVQNELDQLRERAAGAGGATLLDLMGQIDSKINLMAACEKSYARSRYWVASHQHTIDRILGNRAPIHFQAQTVKVPQLVPPNEPQTKDESVAALKDLVNQLRNQIIGGSAQQKSAPAGD